jgi:hypothetical protein
VTVIDRIDLDHVAHAVEAWPDGWPTYRTALGGEWAAADDEDGPGFRAQQLRFRNGMKVELLEPAAVGQNDFLRRFLDRNGPGAHHLTFKVGDIHQALAAAEEAGYRPVGVMLEYDDWKEAFLHPKDAPGVVVQLAESHDTWESPPAPGFPETALARPATLDRVTHAVADLDEGLRLFEGLLRGERLEKGDDELGTWVELGWPGPGRVRLVRLHDDGWLDGRAGRVHHLAFTVAGKDNGVREVAPEDNHGVRLVVTEEA